MKSKTQAALLLTPDGTLSMLPFRIGDRYTWVGDALGGATLEVGHVNLYREKRGTIRVAELAGRVDWYIDDESRLKRLPVNPVATSLWVATHGALASHVCGPVLFVHHNHEGDTIGLSSFEMNTIRDIVNAHFDLTHRVFHPVSDGTWMPGADDPAAKTVIFSSHPVDAEPMIDGDVVVRRVRTTIEDDS
jgi:hypothetical protein